MGLYSPLNFHTLLGRHHSHAVDFFFKIDIYVADLKSGFPRRLEDLENENGHGIVMEQGNVP